MQNRFQPDRNPLLTLTVTEGRGASASCQATVKAVDTTPPVVSCAVTVPQLSPMNGSMRNVGLSILASDNCTTTPALHVSVYSDEPILPNAPDATYSGNVLKLRAERVATATGNGRVYLIVVTATDSAGNSSQCCATVVVPNKPDFLWAGLCLVGAVYFMFRSG